MSNIIKYDDTFKECLQIDDAMLNEALVYNSLATWDSVGHMNLIASLEDVFDIMLDTDDILTFSSYEKGKEILGKYGVLI